jgi:predicted transcriptional regulator
MRWFIVSIYWTPFPGDPEDHRLRGRSYRSEADILSLMLRILEAMNGRPLRKTRLIQYANLNSKSFSKYIEVLEKGGLVECTPRGYVISGRGRLALRVLDLLSSLITPAEEDNDVARVVEMLCPAAEELGLKCSTNSGPFDRLIEYEKGLLGIHVNSCKAANDPQTLAAILKAYSDENTSILLLCTDSKLTGSHSLSDNAIVYHTVKPSRESIRKAIAGALKKRG